ncbi:HK97 family phage prohead protease [Mesorhizobium temperatum]|uniref:HK97 family phage prohead protease n=1 Tax=Mesorhizobium temperatum TaxID=241416 RepID=UPI001FD8AEC7|nr:HK97 family phage prohead protease [Mesorhizobium temperatum]
MADNVISGYCVRFHDIATIGGSFREKIAPAAFTASLKRNDIVALLDHDTGRVLGRTSAKSLTLKQDQIGLYFSLDVDPSTPEGQTAIGTVGRQDVKGLLVRRTMVGGGVARRRRSAAAADSNRD